MSAKQTASEFLGTLYTEDGLHTLKRWRGDFYTWDGSQWSSMSDESIRVALWRYLGDDAKRSAVLDTHDALISQCFLADSVEDGDYIGRAMTRDDTRVFHCTRRKIIDTYKDPQCKTRVSSRVSVSDPDYFNLSSLNISIEPGTTKNDYQCPTWLAFLGDLFGGDAESIALLQEYMGYLISGRTDMQKMLLLVGPKRGGKSTIAKVMEALAGHRNTCSPTLASLSQNFGLQSVIGKKLAVIADARFSGKDADMLVERLLSISGEDQMTIDRKHKEPWTGRLSARFVIISNTAPSLGDSSGTVASRFVKSQLTKSFYGREDPTLEQRLMGELAGIFMWSREGMFRLEKDKRFTVPESSGDLDSMMLAMSSPVSVFIHDRTKFDACSEADTKDVYREYKVWCESNGRHPVNAQRFGADLKAAAADQGVTIETAHRRIGTNRYRVYTGIKLDDDTCILAPFRTVL